jgi:hypothetical protein
MKAPKYAEPCLGWNDEDFKVGLTKYGIAEYAAPTKVKIDAPLAEQIMQKCLAGTTLPRVRRASLDHSTHTQAQVRS